MTQKVTKLAPQMNGRNYGDEKETIRQFVFIAPDPDFKAGEDRRRYARPVELRFYMARSADGASPVYASVWMQSRDCSVYAAGHGSAGGYGYHKSSAAAAEAFRSAGVSLAADIAGRGDPAIIAAVEAVARRLGWSTGEVHEF